MVRAETSAYQPQFDQAAYRRISEAVDGFHDLEQERLDSFTDKQLQTLLSERYNVLTSTYLYEMKDGQLWGENMDEPALASFERGRDFRSQIKDSVDFDREDAEVEGFEKIEEMLRQGRDVLSVSPRGGEGSIYQHNFYDIFKWKSGKIEAKRFSSALNIEDYQNVLDVNFENDAEFLRNPIDISESFETAEEVHAVLHEDHEYMSDEFFNQHLLVATYPYRQGYINALREGNVYLQKLNFNAMLNVADELSEAYENRGADNLRDLVIFSVEKLIEYGNRDVKQKTAGCGYSGGFETSVNLLNTNPFSVKEFGEEKGECTHCKQSSADNHYHCPGCNKRYSDETSKSADSRTKECRCGFKFGC